MILIKQTQQKKKELKGELDAFVPEKKKKKFRASRRSFAKKRIIRKKRKTKTKVKLLKQMIRTRLGVAKPRFGVLFVKPQRRNTFLTLSRRVKNKAKTRFGKTTKKAQWSLVKTFSVGQLGTFKGRARASYIALQKVTSKR